MALGLNTYTAISCNQCGSGCDLQSAMKSQNHRNLDDTYHCKCGNSFTYHQGIINDYCSDHFGSYYNFISDIIERGSCEIIVGETYTIKFNRNIPIINKVFLSPYGGSAAVYVEPSIFRTQDSMKVISSERKDNLHFATNSIIKV